MKLQIYVYDFYLDNTFDRHEAAGIPRLDFPNEDEESRRRHVCSFSRFFILIEIFTISGTVCQTSAEII
jgi:hypothetical protein